MSRLACYPGEPGLQPLSPEPEPRLSANQRNQPSQAQASERAQILTSPPSPPHTHTLLLPPLTPTPHWAVKLHSWNSSLAIWQPIYYFTSQVRKERGRRGEVNEGHIIQMFKIKIWLYQAAVKSNNGGNGSIFFPECGNMYFILCTLTIFMKHIFISFSLTIM